MSCAAATPGRHAALQKACWLRLMILRFFLLLRALLFAFKMPPLASPPGCCRAVYY